MEEFVDIPIEIEKKKPTLVKDLSEVLNSQGIDKNSTFEPHPDQNLRSRITELFGDPGAEVLLAKTHEQKKAIVNLPYATGLSALVVLEDKRASEWASLQELTGITNNLLQVEDIIYASQVDGKSFSYKFVLAEGASIEIDGSLKFDAFGGIVQQLPPIGYFRPPSNLIERGKWNVYKKVEPLTLLHEARHSQQIQDLNQYTDPQRERDAWAYALKTYRKLRDEGLNLLPDIQSNNQIISRLELGLISYDIGQQNTPNAENYSRRFQQPSPARTTNCVDRLFQTTQTLAQTAFKDPSVDNLFKTTRTLAQTAFKDPSLVTDTLFYAGQPRLTRVPMTSLVRR